MPGSITWERTPLALRVGLLLTLARHVLQIGVTFAVGDDRLHGNGHTLLDAIEATWAPCVVLTMIGAIELMRRAPSAIWLVIGSVWQTVMILVWLGTMAYMSRFGSDYMFTFKAIGYIAFVGTLTMAIGWCVLTRNPLLMVAIIVTKVVANLPFLSDDIYRVFGGGYAVSIAIRGVVDVLGTVAALAIATGVPFARPHIPRPASPHVFVMLASVVAIVGVAEVLLASHALDHGLSTFASVVAIAGLVWFAAIAARVRIGGEPGAVGLVLAAALWLTAAMIRFAPLMSSSSRDELTASDIAAPTLLVPLLAIAGLVFALAGVTRIARARGAEQALRVVSACALIVVVSGVASLGASWGDTVIPAMLRIGGLMIAFAAAAVGLHAASAALGGPSDLPTATLRSS